MSFQISTLFEANNKIYVYYSRRQVIQADKLSPNVRISRASESERLRLQIWLTLSEVPYGVVTDGIPVQCQGQGIKFVLIRSMTSLNKSLGCFSDWWFPRYRENGMDDSKKLPFSDC